MKNIPIRAQRLEDTTASRGLVCGAVQGQCSHRTLRVTGSTIAMQVQELSSCLPLLKVAFSIPSPGPGTVRSYQWLSRADADMSQSSAFCQLTGQDRTLPDANVTEVTHLAGGSWNLNWRLSVPASLCGEIVKCQSLSIQERCSQGVWAQDCMASLQR